jgi:hypothetical protein
MLTYLTVCLFSHFSPEALPETLSRFIRFGTFNTLVQLAGLCNVEC